MDLHRLLGVELPVIQAPMAGAHVGALAIAVCQAGGLGSLPCDARHRGDRSAARRRGGAREPRFLADLVPPERERLQGAAGGRADA